MPMLGAYFVGFVMNGNQSYWNDEIGEALCNAFNKETMDGKDFEASKVMHLENVRRTLS